MVGEDFECQHGVGRHRGVLADLVQQGANVAVDLGGMFASESGKVRAAPRLRGHRPAFGLIHNHEFAEAAGSIRCIRILHYKLKGILPGRCDGLLGDVEGTAFCLLHHQRVGRLRTELNAVECEAGGHDRAGAFRAVRDDQHRPSVSAASFTYWLARRHG